MAKKTEPRKALHAYLSDESHDAWHDYAAEKGVSVSGLLEAIAQTGTLSWKDNSEVVKAARKIDVERRRRRR